jgi:hypothetical protein
VAVNGSLLWQFERLSRYCNGKVPTPEPNLHITFHQWLRGALHWIARSITYTYHQKGFAHTFHNNFVRLQFFNVSRQCIQGEVSIIHNSIRRVMSHVEIHILGDRNRRRRRWCDATPNGIPGMRKIDAQSDGYQTTRRLTMLLQFTKVQWVLSKEIADHVAFSKTHTDGALTCNK